MQITLSEDEKYRIFTKLEDIPSDMVEATLLYEDRSFYKHGGVNILALGRAVYSMLLGGRRVGASTLSMQLVRLSQSLKTNTVLGKVKQIWHALVLEYHYTKEEILEAYLNLAPYGANVEGIGAAARVWFHKDAQNLNIAEILALVTVPQNPVARNPLFNQGKAFSEARLRLNELWNEENPHELNSVFAQIPLRVYSPKDLPFEAPHLLMEIAENRKKNMPYKNEHGELYSSQAKTSPIKTTLDLPLQKNLEHLLKRYIESKSHLALKNASVLLVDWRSGEVRALLGSVDFFNKEIHGQVDGSRARRSPGSTLKPFIYGLALDQGLIHPKTILADTPKTFFTYDPENADGAFRGPVSAQNALQASRNIPAVFLASKLKYPELYEFLKSSGIAFEKAKEHYGLSLVLGGAEMSMRELAGLYAALPNHGRYRPLKFMENDRGYDRESAMGSGRTNARNFDLDSDMKIDSEAVADIESKQILSPEASYIVLDMLQRPSPLAFGKGRASWKTGTSNGLRDAWTVGVFGPYVLVVWVGNFDGSPSLNFTGLDAAAPLFFQILEYLHSVDKESRRNYLPEIRQGLNLRKIPVCASTGDIQVNLCEDGVQSETWFIPGVSPIKESGILREILVNTQTGLRECIEKEGFTQREIWEFWPADMRTLFRRAGVHKKPVPPFAPHCAEFTEAASGLAPLIQSPSMGFVYHQSMSKKTKIPLLAHLDADASYVHWFADNQYLGVSNPDEILFWEPVLGNINLRAVDDLGRYSSIQVQVESVP